MIPVDFGWGNPIDIEYVKNIIEKTKIDAVMMVHHETSSGMLNPIYLIGELLNELKVDFLVDAVSSIGAEELSVEKQKLHFVQHLQIRHWHLCPDYLLYVGKRRF